MEFNKKGQEVQSIFTVIDQLVKIGYVFLTFGLLFGALWAKEAWGHYSTWDPKETWAFITWLGYLVYLHHKYNHKEKTDNEKEFITTDNINQVRFYVIDTGRGIGKKNPTLQIFDNEEKILVEMTISVNDYYLLKKYFTKH